MLYRFLARYSPPQSETLHYEMADDYEADADGQLSLFEARAVTEPEPPDPDDFASIEEFREVIAIWDEQNESNSVHCEHSFVHSEPNSAHCEHSFVHSEPNSVHCQPPDPDDFASIEEFREVIALWDAESPEPLAVSMDSMCEWAPCPEEWYEPKAEKGPLKASSMLEPSKVMELSPVYKSPSTSDFFIPTFGAEDDRTNARDEPPDTGRIFARSPQPKPPNFPPQASQPTVNSQQSTVSWVSRSYPETIPKLSRNYFSASPLAAAPSQPDRRQEVMPSLRGFRMNYFVNQSADICFAIVFQGG